MADEPQIAGGVINVPTTSTGTASTLAIITIVKRAMRIVGSFGDAVVEATGLEALQDCINDITIRNSFDFTTTKDTEIPLIEDQREYSIPDAAFGLKELVLVKESETPEDIRPLGYIDWDQLQRLFFQSGSGRPAYWTARDVFFDRKVQLIRPPDATTALDWKLRIWYHTAIPRPPVNDKFATIAAPEVVSTLIQRYVEYRLLTVYGDPNDPRRREAYRDYRDLLNNLRGMENRSRPGGHQIRPQGMVMGRTGFNGRRWPAGGQG